MASKRVKQPIYPDCPSPKRRTMGSTPPRRNSSRPESEEDSEVKAEQVATHNDEEASPDNPKSNTTELPNGLPNKSDGARRETPETPSPTETRTVTEGTVPDTYMQILRKAAGVQEVDILQHNAAMNQLNRKNGGRWEPDGLELADQWNVGIGAMEDLAFMLAKDRKLSSGSNLVLRAPRTWDNLAPELQDELCCWTPHAKEIFEDPLRVHFLYAARIWHTIDKQLFSAGSESVREWLGPDWARFAEMKEVFKAKGHDQPWKKGELDAAYNLWRWYTAKLLYYTFDRFPTGRLVKAVCQHIIHDLEPLLNPTEDEIEYCQAELENGLYFISEVFKHTSLEPSKYWLAWKPQDSKNIWGFRVSSTTDEGHNVFMKPPVYRRAPPVKNLKGRDLEGEEVHLVLCPAMAVTHLYDEGPSHHFVGPMTVVVDDYLNLNGVSSMAPPDKGGPAPCPTTSTTDKVSSREDKPPAVVPPEVDIPLHSPTLEASASTRSSESPGQHGPVDNNRA